MALFRYFFAPVLDIGDPRWFLFGIRAGQGCSRAGKHRSTERKVLAGKRRAQSCAGKIRKLFGLLLLVSLCGREHS